MDGDPRGEPAALSEQRSARSRRAFLTGGSAAAAATLLGACAAAKPLSEEVRGGASITPSDVAPLNRLLDAEQYAVAAYAASVPLLPPRAHKSAMQFLAQELAHASQLTDLIHRAKGKPNRPAAHYDLGDPQSSAQVMALLMHIEQVQLSAYLAAIPQLSDSKARAAVAAIFANDAQHLAWLRWQSGQPPVASARVTGS